MEDHLELVLDQFIWIISQSVIYSLRSYPLTLPSADTPEPARVTCMTGASAG